VSNTRRDVLKMGALAAGASLALSTLPIAAAGSAEPAAGKAAEPAPAGKPRPLKILILGGTGFTGPHQVRYALARGHQVTLFNRGKRPKQDWPGKVEELLGDRSTGNLKSLETGEWDVCIDNPTSVPFWVRDVGKVLKGRVKQYVFISTISVFAQNAKPNDESAETAKYTGKDIYAETRDTLMADMSLYGPMKAACEREAETWFPGINTVIRPGLIVGPGDETDRFTYWPVRLARGGDVLAPSLGSDPVQIIDARDLAEWTIRMVEQRDFGTFNATGPDYELSIAAMLHGIRAVTTAGAKLHWVPAEFLAAQNVSPWGDMPVWVPDDAENAGFGRTIVTKAVSKGLTFRPLATTAADALAWFNSQPAERREKLRAGITAEREKEVLAAWKAKA
jgi:2'-hydroxyisoflavone reductase